MLELDHVTDNPHLFGENPLLFDDASLELPRGRYALFSTRPEFHRALIDVLAGLRPPRRGLVRHQGFVSWPVGRPAFVRGTLTGLQLTRFICSLYGVDFEPCVEFLTGIMTSPEYLSRKMTTWPRYVAQEFTFSMALAPAFDVFFVDGLMPIEESRFSRLWQSLFEQRLVGRSLIFSCHQPAQLTDYCTMGLIYEDGRFRTDDDLERCIRRYPLRQSRVEQPDSDGGGVGGDVASTEDDDLFF